MTLSPIDIGRANFRNMEETSLFPSGDAGGYQAFLVFDDPVVGFRLGVFGTSVAGGFSASSPAHIFVHVREGAFTLRADGARVSLSRGQVAVIRQGADVEWRQESSAWVDFCAFTEDSGSAQGEAVTVVPADLPLQPSAPSPAAMLLGEVPTQAGMARFSDTSGRFKAGVWQSTPYHRKTIPFPRHEFMHLMEGEVILTPPEGESATFRAGDTFLIPRGWVADWNASRAMKKFYCTFTY